MVIPLANTTITVKRLTNQSNQGSKWDQGYGQPGDTADTYEVVSTGTRAVISANGGRNLTNARDTEVIQYTLVCDHTDLDFKDQVVDETTGYVFDLQWTAQNPGVGFLANTQAGMTRTSTKEN